MPRPSVDEIKEKASTIVEEHTGEELREYNGYSGRGMFGRTSQLAFAADVDPRTKEGHELQAMGLKCDNLGRGWIYYLS